MNEGWTLAELVGRVAQALASADVRAPNGRVTELPDARMIRWYATIGLVDRPAGFRGRTALYGPRHLLQLVAVKRRQAAGLPLARIQAELAGATDETLHRVALLPADQAADRPHRNPAARASSFWAAPPAPAPPAPAPPALAPPAPVPVAPLVPVPEQPWPAPSLTVHGVSLGGGATLLVGSAAVGEHVAAIRAAAQPLLDVLSALGLLHPDEGVPA